MGHPSLCSNNVVTKIKLMFWPHPEIFVVSNGKLRSFEIHLKYPEWAEKQDLLRTSFNNCAKVIGSWVGFSYVHSYEKRMSAILFPNV